MNVHRRRALGAAATKVLGSDAPRTRFRRFLRSGAMDLAQMREHLARAVPQLAADPEARLAVEELVSHAGSLLGFSTARDDSEDLDIWTSATGVSVVVRVVPGDEVSRQLPLLAHARDHLLVSLGAPAHKVSALCVACGSRIDWRHIEEAVAFRRTLRDVRLVSLDALLTLVALRTDRVLAHTDAVVLLRPPDARADAVIDLVARYRRLAEPQNSDN
jgi:hypothetical protein